MKKIIIASTRPGAGKTSLMTGLMADFKSNSAYLKPLGDRLIYKRKKNCDYDANFMVNYLGLDQDPENLSLGFDHLKLKYKYNDLSALYQALDKNITMVSSKKEFLFIEGGSDIFYGSSLGLDPLSLAKNLKASLVLVVSGDDNQIMDDIKFIKNHIDLKGIDFAGVIVNKIQDVDDFALTLKSEILDLGINLLGTVPYKEKLVNYTVKYLSEQFFAKVITGEDNLDNVIENIFVGAMSTGESLRNPLFNKSNKLLITSGDRVDMTLAALESDTVGILLTNNILPSSKIISKAAEKNIPILLVTNDTYEMAKKIDKLEALISNDNQERIKFFTDLSRKYLESKKVLE